MFKFFKKKNKVDAPEIKMHTLCKQKTENGPVEKEMVDTYYLLWFVESGKDLDFFKCWVEE